MSIDGASTDCIRFRLRTFQPGQGIWRRSHVRRLMWGTGQACYDLRRKAPDQPWIMSRFVGDCSQTLGCASCGWSEVFGHNSPQQSAQSPFHTLQMAECFSFTIKPSQSPKYRGSVPSRPFCEHRIKQREHFSRQVLRRGAKFIASYNTLHTDEKDLEIQRRTWLTWLHFELQISLAQMVFCGSPTVYWQWRRPGKWVGASCLKQTYPQQTFPGDAVHELLAQKKGAGKCKQVWNLAKPRFVIEGPEFRVPSYTQIGMIPYGND